MNNPKTFACSNCKTILEYNPREDYLFSCKNCGERFQVDKGKLVVRYDLQPAPIHTTQINTPNDLWKVAAAICIGVFIAILCVIAFSNNNSSTPSQQTTSIQKLATQAQTSKRSASSTVTESNTELPVTFSYTPSDDKIVNIAEIVNQSSSDDFNSVLSIQISNPYSKPISKVQLYINQDGNTYIPDDLTENSWQLINIDLSELMPGKSETVNIETKDKGSKMPIYAINTRKIRFSNGDILSY